MARHRTPDRQKKSRNVTSFFLYIFIVIFSLSVCSVAVASNPKSVAKIFTSSRYVESLKSDIAEYANDKCVEASIPNDFVNTTIVYEEIHQLQEAYIFGSLKVSEQYNADAFEVLLSDYNEIVKKQVNTMIKEQNIKVSSKTGVDEFCDSIINYTRDRIEFEYIKELKSFVNKAYIISFVTLGFSAIMVIILIFALVKNGGKNYRITRNISYSFLASAFLELFLVFAGVMVKVTKDLVIFPTYLANTFMDFYNSVLLSVVFSTAIMFLISLVLAAATWNYKRRERD